jgi:hypothetical protein
MSTDIDAAAVIGAIDAALLEQARQWRALTSRYRDADETLGMDWAEEFCLVVHNRLAKLRTQQELAQVRRASSGSHRPSLASAVRQRPRRTTGKMVSRRMQDVQST